MQTSGILFSKMHACRDTNNPANRAPNQIGNDKIYDMIPLKKEVKATVSGLYITEVRGMRGPLPVPPKKEGFFKRMKNKAAKKDAAK